MAQLVAHLHGTQRVRGSNLTDLDEHWVAASTNSRELAGPQPEARAACPCGVSRTPLEALEMAIWARDRDGEDVTGLIQHSDAGSQGGFQ